MAWANQSCTGAGMTDQPGYGVSRRACRRLFRLSATKTSSCQALLVRHYLEAYDGVMAGQSNADRQLTEGTLAGLRLMRNRVSDEETFALATAFLNLAVADAPAPAPADASARPRERRS
jgi:hypothetical protein